MPHLLITCVRPTHRSSFIATATWISVYHSLNVKAKGSYFGAEANSPSDTSEHVGPKDTQVSLQYLKRYIYTECCSKDKVLATMKSANEEKECLCLEREQQETTIRKICVDQTAERQPFLEKVYLLQ